MKRNNLKYANQKAINLGETCGNCWGHQEYRDVYLDKIVDVLKGKKDHFLSRFVRKYIVK